MQKHRCYEISHHTPPQCSGYYNYSSIFRLLVVVRRWHRVLCPASRSWWRDGWILCKQEQDVTMSDVRVEVSRPWPPSVTSMWPPSQPSLYTQQHNSQLLYRVSSTLKQHFSWYMNLCTKLIVFLCHECMYTNMTTQDLNMNRSVYIEGVVFSAWFQRWSDPADHPRDEA